MIDCENKQPLTMQQYKVLRVIVQHWMHTMTSPTLREICTAMGISSPNGVHCHLISLERKGWIKVGKALTRGIILPELVAIAKTTGHDYLAELEKWFTQTAKA